MSALDIIPIRESDGNPVVSGRDLHAFLGLGRDYTTWFKAMAEYGFVEGSDYLPVSGEVARNGRGTVERTDHALTLDMAKELAMIQRTDRGKQARQYFIEVEKRSKRSPVLSEDEIVHQALAITSRKVKELEARVTELAPRADAWDELASADGDYSVADAAKILARAGVRTGPQRLFEQLADMRWIHRGHDGKWRAYASAVDDGYLAEKPQSHHHPRTGELVLDSPQVRVTLRGLERLRVRLGMLAVA